MACSEWKVPCEPVKPWQMTLVFSLTSTAIWRSPISAIHDEGFPAFGIEFEHVLLSAHLGFHRGLAGLDAQRGKEGLAQFFRVGHIRGGDRTFELVRGRHVELDRF